MIGRLLVIATTLAFGGIVGADDKPVTAPSVALKGIDGRTVRIADSKGKVLLVDFWASWCTGCKASFPALDAMGRSMRDRGVEVLAVSVDEKRKDLDAFLHERPTDTLRVLLDPRMSAADAFRVTVLPTAFIIDRSGRIRFTHAGYGPKAVEQFSSEVHMLIDEPSAVVR
jgi:peroxiredoxin